MRPGRTTPLSNDSPGGTPSAMTPAALRSEWLQSGMEHRRELARLYPDHFVHVDFLQSLREGLVEMKEMPPSYLAENYSTVTKTNSFGKREREPPQLRRVSLEVLSTQQQCNDVIALYTTQFEHPDAGTFRRIVSIPPARSTRTRTIHDGPFTWILRSLDSNSVVCAATGHIHRHSSNSRFMEIAFFATSKAFVGKGYARLMNALLQHHARDVGCSYVLICASQGAMPFWLKPSLGYSMMRSDLKAQLELYYREKCSQFKDTEALVWYVTDDTPLLVSTALRRIADRVEFSYLGGSSQSK